MPTKDLFRISRYDSAAKSEMEQHKAEEILGTAYIYERIYHDQRPMTFLADGTVGLGTAGREVYWDLRQEGDQMVLEIASETEVTCRLVESGEGGWEGHWLHCERMPILVRPLRVYSLETSETASQDVEAPAACPAVKWEGSEQFTHAYQAAVYIEDRSDFTRVQNANVLIYFRHGLGDLVMFSYLLPLLDRSNRYWITRFGDDYTSLMEGSAYVTPLYLGSNSTLYDHSAAFHNQHFGIDAEHGDGSFQTIQLPLSLYHACKQNEIDTILDLNCPEIHGRNRYPFHSKPRYLLPALVDRQNLDKQTLSCPLPTAINFAVDPWIVHWVSSRLSNYGGFGERKLCLISRNGYTIYEKNWGHQWREEMPEGKQREGEECRDFMRLMLRKDPRWMFVIMEDRLFSGDDTMRSEELHAYSFAELFGSVGQAGFPFGIVVKALVNLASLSIGVPTGPYHLSMAKPELPTIGLWLEHLPVWYDEPKPNSLHIVSRNITDKGLHLRPGSFTDQGDLHFPTRWVDSRIITGEQVLEAVETLL